MLQSVTECYRVLQSVTEYYRVLQNISEYYRVLQNITEYYRVLQSITEYYKVLQSITKTNLAHLLGPIFGLVYFSQNVRFWMPASFVRQLLTMPASDVRLRHFPMFDNNEPFVPFWWLRKKVAMGKHSSQEVLLGC